MRFTNTAKHIKAEVLCCYFFVAWILPVPLIHSFLFPSPSEVYFHLCSFICLYNSSFSSRLNTVWGWRVVALSSCCCSYISPGDHSAADELDQRSVTTDNWFLQKNCVPGLAPAQRKGWKQEDGTGWNLGVTFHSITQTGSIWLRNCKGTGLCEIILFKSTFKSAAFFSPTDLLYSSYTNNCISTCEDVLSCGTKICHHKATV